MFDLRCTVRGCNESLQRRERELFCDSGHNFDRAKEGYWNLTQPQDKRSLNPGDSDEAVLARHRWLKRGLAAGLVDTLLPWASRFKTGQILDLGCGEGSFGPALFAANAGGYCGVDLSRRAIKLAARGWPQATWVLANADRILPVADSTIDLVISLFGRRPGSEIGRVLKSNGTCIVAVPGEEDLIELRESVQESGHRRNRCQTIIEEMTGAGLELIEQESWHARVHLDQEAINDALAMTYRSGRNSRQAKLESLTAMTVTLAADLLLLRENSDS